MNRRHWTYVDNAGRKNEIGIVHFPKRSGHLLIYINKRISTVDFKIFEPKTYSFFIEGELCEISIEKEGEQYFYEFEINKEVDTPVNRFRKKQTKKHLKQALGVFAILFLTIFVFVFLFSRRQTENYEQEAKALTLENSAKGIAKLLQQEDKKTFLYQFVAQNQVFERTISADELLKATEQTGFPPTHHAEFTVLYAAQKPQISRLLWEQPTAAQVIRYKKQAADYLAQNDIRLDRKTATCYVEIAHEMHQLKGVALCLYLQSSSNKNAIFNANAYKRMVRNVPFQKAVKQRCFD